MRDSTLYGTQTSTQWHNLTIVPSWNAGLGFVFAYGTAGRWDQFGFLYWDRVLNSDGGSPKISWCGGTSRRVRFSIESLARLVLAMTCGNAFQTMRSNQPATCMTLGQYLLATPHKGAVVVTGPARAIYEQPAYAISVEWFSVVFGSGSGYVEPGTAMRQVKSALWAGLQDPL